MSDGGKGAAGARATGGLRVESDPSGAMIFLDGDFTGQFTDAEVPSLAPGPHRVEVRFDYYDQSERPLVAEVVVVAGSVATVRLESGTSARGEPGVEGAGEQEPVLVIDEQTPDPVPVQPCYVRRTSPLPGAPALSPTAPSALARGGATFVDLVAVHALVSVLADALPGSAAMTFTPMASALGAGLILFRDVLFGPGRSLGKTLFGYRVLGPGGKPCGAAESVRRNLVLAVGYLGVALAQLLVWVLPGFLHELASLVLPVFSLVSMALVALEAFLVCTVPGGTRLGDRLAGTSVRRP